MLGWLAPPLIVFLSREPPFGCTGSPRVAAGQGAEGQGVGTQASQTTASAPDRQRHPLARGIEILTLMIDGGEQFYGVRELAGRLGVSASTAHRLLSDLEELGMVSRTPAGHYRLGMEFLRLAWTASTRFPLRDAANDVLADLAARSGESSFFGLYSEQRRQMMFAVSVESSHPLRYTVPQG